MRQTVNRKWTYLLLNAQRLVRKISKARVLKYDGQEALLGQAMLARASGAALVRVCAGNDRLAIILVIDTTVVVLNKNKDAPITQVGSMSLLNKECSRKNVQSKLTYGSDILWGQYIVEINDSSSPISAAALLEELSKLIIRVKAFYSVEDDAIKHWFDEILKHESFFMQNKINSFIVGQSKKLID